MEQELSSLKIDDRFKMRTIYLDDSERRLLKEIKKEKIKFKEEMEKEKKW